MTYCCDNCSFLFQRVNPISKCPLCEKNRIRPATKDEAERLQNLLKQKVGKKEEFIP